MDLLSFAKSLGAKIFGAAETAAAPPEQIGEEAGKYDLDVSQVEVKSEGDEVILPGNPASTEAAETIASDSPEGAAADGDAEKVALAIDDPEDFATVQNDIAAASEAPESKV